MLKRTLAALIVALTAFCGGTAQAEPLKLTFSTGSVGGGFFAVGSGIAGFASQKIPGISITAISAAGVVESINRLEQGKADFAMLNTQDPPLAWEGKAPTRSSIGTCAAWASCTCRPPSLHPQVLGHPHLQGSQGQDPQRGRSRRHHASRLLPLGRSQWA